MIFRVIKLRRAGLASLALFLILSCIALAAYPPEADLSVHKEAAIAGNSITEVNPGADFDYVITVANHNPSNSAPLAVVTDKLPYEVAFRSINVSSDLGPNIVNKSGDLIYVRFDLIPANTTGEIIISVTAPTEGPTTLYNMVNVRYGNDPNQSNNRMTISTYVPLAGYDQIGSSGADWISTPRRADITSDCGCSKSQSS